MTSAGDIRLSEPNGNSIYEALTFKKKAPENVKVEEPKAHSFEKKDNKKIDNSTKVPENTSIDFVDKKQNTNSIPLRNENGDILKMITDEKGFPILDAAGQIQFDNVNGSPVYVKSDSNGNAILDEEGNFQVVESASKQVPTNNISFSEDELPSLDDINQKPIDKNTKQDKGIELSLPLLNPSTGQIMKFKVDDKGKPILDKTGNPIEDPAGKPLFVKVNEEGQPILNKEGQFTFVEEQKKTLPHSANRAMAGVYARGVSSGLTKLSTTLVKGMSVSIPFTSKTIGFGVKHAVQKAVTAELAKVAVAKTGSTTIVKALEQTAKGATAGTIKTLTNAGALGKGTETITRSVFGKWFQPSAYTQVIKESANGLAKTTKAVAEGGAKVAGETVLKTAIGSSEKILQKGVQEGIEAGVKTVIKKGGKEIAETIATKGTQKALTVTAEKAAVKAATTGTAKAGSKLGAAVPVIGAAVGLAVTAWDVHDAIKKTKDPTVSKLSAGLAWTTVGLDVVSTAATATGIGAPIGWVASGLSIVTSIGSDYFK